MNGRTKAMKALVTGATGFIGRHLAENLTRNGHEVVCLVRDAVRLPPEIAAKARVAVGDLSKFEAMQEAARDVEVIFHVAGLTKALSPTDFFEVNRIGTRRLIEAALQQAHPPRRFIFLSSLAAMGPCTKGGPHTEAGVCLPLTPYGRSKLAGEGEVKAVGERLPYTILRPPGVFGPADRETFPFFKLASWGIVPAVAGEGFLSAIHVQDLVRAIVAAACAENAAGETFLVAEPRTYTWTELATAIRDAVNPRARIVHIPRRVVVLAGRIADGVARFRREASIFGADKARDLTQDAWTCSVSHAEKVIGFRCNFSLQSGLRDTALWYRQAGWL
jgi:nucleoside-diphosphate-sugar epimerase